MVLGLFQMVLVTLDMKRSSTLFRNSFLVNLKLELKHFQSSLF